ncbi:Rhomboid-like protein 15, partial [Dichanthelium oligosanthes]
MRPNIITEAGIPTRLNQWWSSIPFITSGVVLICGAIYLACLLIGYDSYVEICFLPSAVASHFQVYRFYTSVLFHGSLLHVLFNMLALVPLGTELERIMGSVRLLFLMFLLATTNAILHLTIAFLVVYPVPYLVDECTIGFSGVIFSMIVIETSLSGVQSRSVFGLFNVPAKWYSFIACIDVIHFQFTRWHTVANTVRADATVTADQVDTFDEELKKLVGMGFEKTQAEVALAAADGDPNVAIEILMSQQ